MDHPDIAARGFLRSDLTQIERIQRIHHRHNQTLRMLNSQFLDCWIEDLNSPEHAQIYRGSCIYEISWEHPLLENHPKEYSWRLILL